MNSFVFTSDFFYYKVFYIYFQFNRNDERNLRNLQQVACQKLIELIERPRELLTDQIHFPRAGRWNQVI
jgi:hypothetical protein